MSDPFDSAMKKAEAALKSRRSASPFVSKDGPKSQADSNGWNVVPSKPTPGAKQATAEPPVYDRSHLTINSVRVPSWNDLMETEKRLRDDFNEVLDNFELPDIRPLEIKLVAPDDTQLGKLDELTHRQFDTLVRLASVRSYNGARKNIMKKGPLGGGKSTAGKQLAKLFNLDFDYIGQTNMPHEVMGYVHPVTGKYMWTAFTRAYVHGGVVYLEEMDGWSANATLVLNPPLANGYITLPDGTKHDRHPDCVIVACTNTWGNGPTAEYVGRNKLDTAFLDRFVKIDWQYDEELERLAARDDHVVNIVQTARFNANKYGIKVAVSPRCSVDVADMVRHGFGLEDALNMSFLAGVDKDQRKMLLEDCII